MKLLVVGSGGREHTLVWRLADCPSVTSIVAAPGNPGMARQALCRPVAADDIEGLVALAHEEGIDLVVVGPELPLTLRLADRLRSEGILCFGPGADGARLEGSKAWAKELMGEAGIPTAAWQTFTDLHEAERWLVEGEGPVVVKASGLAAGKGVLVCEDRRRGVEAVRAIMGEGLFGEAGRTVVIEEFLQGEEASILAITDGRSLLMLPSSQDHKRAGEGDTGPNTGGMGAYAPAPVVTPEVADRVRHQVLEPLLQALRKRGIDYRGVLYAGLMIDEAGSPRVIEFNCRFGDPEAQAVLPLTGGDLALALRQAAEGRLDPEVLVQKPGAAVCVVLASAGYPEAYPKGKPITGLEQIESRPGVMVFHAGTALHDRTPVTAGGRVLGVTAWGENIRMAVDRVYDAISQIGFDGIQYRKDIAHRALARIR